MLILNGEGAGVMPADMVGEFAVNLAEFVPVALGVADQEEEPQTVGVIVVQEFVQMVVPFVQLRFLDAAIRFFSEAATDSGLQKPSSKRPFPDGYPDPLRLNSFLRCPVPGSSDPGQCTGHPADPG